FKELKMCLHELSLVDNTIEAVGAPKEYQRLHKWISRIMMGLNALIWGTILGYICSRFHQVNDRLHVFYSDLFENNVDYKLYTSTIQIDFRV
ncbi:hypothetical protein ALC60_02579, partial [Trachymyrmex zeteki]